MPIFAPAAFGVTGVTAQYELTLRLPPSQHGVVRPAAISHDPVAGETCVTDARGPAILLVNRRDVAVFRTNRFAALSAPLDACVDARGSLVFLDVAPGDHTRTVRRLNLHGEPDAYAVRPPAARWSPNHLIVCRDGDYLTLDGDTGIMARHDAVTGDLVWRANVTGDESDELFLGRPCEAPDGSIYLPGGELHAVLVLDDHGNLVSRFGEFGTGPGKMIFPVAVAMGPAETVLVLDRMRHKILVHDRDHRLVTEFGSIGAAPGQLYQPSDIATTDDGRLYVAQGFEGRVQVFQLAVTGRP